MTAKDSEIKAGEYELVSEVWEQPGKQELGLPYQFTRHVKGDIVHLDADEAKRLVTSGAVVRKGERERAAAAAAVAAAHAALALIPADQRDALGVDLPAVKPQDSVPPGEVPPASTAAPKPTVK